MESRVKATSKIIIFDYVAKVNRVPAAMQPVYTVEKIAEDSFTSTVAFTVLDKQYKATGVGITANSADNDAFRIIHEQLISDGHPIRPLSSYSQSNVYPLDRVHKRQHAIIAFEVLRVNPGDGNYITQLSEFAWYSRLGLVPLRTTPPTDEAPYYTTEITLRYKHTGTTLTTSPHVSPVMVDSRQAAAKEMLGLLREHLSVDVDF